MPNLTQTQPHNTTKALDRELGDLLKAIARIGDMAESQIDEAARTMPERADRRGAEVVKRDQEIDRLEAEIQQKILHLLALRAPVADDLRLVVSAISAASAFERVAARLHRQVLDGAQHHAERARRSARRCGGCAW